MTIMLLNKLASTATSVVILTTGILGGIHGNALEAERIKTLESSAVVSDFISAAAADAQAYEGSIARTVTAEFAPTRDAAQALVDSSAGKASDASRAALSALIAEYDAKIAVRFETGSEARAAATSLTATAVAPLAAASQVVTDEVAAYEAEQARIAAEAAAAAESSRSNGGGGSYSGSNGGSNNGGGSGGGNSGGGGSCTDRYAATAAANGAAFEIIPGNTSYYDGGVIQMGNGPANACADAVFSHELAHHFTMGSGRAGCADISRNLNSAAGLGQRHVETWAQAYTQTYWGWAADWAYAPAPQSYIDGMSAAGCL